MNLLKRTLACLLAVLMLVGMLSTSAFAATSFTAGDVNDDGKVDLLDVMIGLRLLAGHSYKGKYVGQALFVNGDGLGDLSDVIMILRKSAGWDVGFTPAAANAEVWQMENYTFSIVNSTIKMMSQNLLHSSDLKGRDSALKLLAAKYTPDVISFQEYRSAWTSAVAGEKNSVTTSKVKYLDRDGNVTATANNYNYVVNTTSSSVLGTGYQGYVQTRADLNQMYTSVGAAHTAYANYQAAVAAYGEENVDPLDYAPQIDERLAIYWNSSKLTLMDQGRFLITDDPDDEYRPTPGKANPIVWRDDLTKDYDEDGVITDNDFNGDGVINDNDKYFYNNDNRLVIWVKLKIIATGMTMYVFNAHGPNVSDDSASVEAEMIPSMNIVMEKMDEIIRENGDDPDSMSVFLTGDLNVDYFGYKAAYGYYDRPAWEVITKTHGYTDISVAQEGDTPQGTFRGSDVPGNVKYEGENGWRISAKPDYFFSRGTIFSTCLNYKVLLETYKITSTTSGGNTTYTATYAGEFDPLAEDIAERSFISDHFGIYGEFVIT